MKKHRVDKGDGALLSAHHRLNPEPPMMMVLAFCIVMLLAAAIGYVTASQSLIIIVAFTAIAAVTYMTFKSPRAGLVLLLIFTSTLIAPEFLYLLNPKNVYNGYDGMLVLVIVSSMIEAARIRKDRGLFERFYSSPVAIAFTVFAAVIVIKSLTIIIENRFAPGTISKMYSFNRTLSLYLLFAPALLLFDTPKKQRWMTMVFFALGGVVITRVILELMFPGWSLFQIFSVAQPLADEMPTVDVSVQRLRAPGGTFMLACFWIGLMNLALRSWSWKRLALYIPVTLMMLLGIVLEFNRSYVIPMMLLFVVALTLNRERVRARLLTMVTFVLLVVVILLFSTSWLDAYVDATVVRYGSAFSSESLESQSIQGREIEQQYAWAAIQKSPFFGIALDEYYRPPVPNMLDNLRWYIHDSYIWFWTYFGLIGLASFLFVLCVAILRSFIYWKRVHDPFLQTVVLGFAFSLLTLMSANIAAPKFYEFAAVPVVAVMLGLMEAIIISSKQEEESGNTEA